MEDKSRIENDIKAVLGESVQSSHPQSRIEVLLHKFAEGGIGTTDYTALENKPKINDVELDGNKSLDDIGVTSAILSAIAQTNHLSKKIVTALPPIETAEEDVIYLVKKANGENIYAQWTIVIENDEKKFANLGTTEVDLSDYYIKTEIDTKLSEKANTTDVDEQLAHKINKINKSMNYNVNDKSFNEFFTDIMSKEFELSKGYSNTSVYTIYNEKSITDKKGTMLVTYTDIENLTFFLIDNHVPPKAYLRSYEKATDRLSKWVELANVDKVNDLIEASKNGLMSTEEYIGEDGKIKEDFYTIPVPKSLEATAGTRPTNIDYSTAFLQPYKNQMIYQAGIKKGVSSAPSDGELITAVWDDANFGEQVFLSHGVERSSMYIRSKYQNTYTPWISIIDQNNIKEHVTPILEEVGLSDLTSLIETNNIKNFKYIKGQVDFDTVNNYIPTAADEGLTIYGNVIINKISQAETAIGFLHVFVNDDGRISSRLIMISTDFAGSGATYSLHHRLLIKSLCNQPAKWGQWQMIEFTNADYLNNATQTASESEVRDET